MIRAIRPEDKQRLSAALSRLSPASSRGRFLTAKLAFTASELRYLTEIDGIHHDALIAVLAEDPDELVAVGRYVCHADDPTAAEVAIVVGDCHQRQGLGRRIGLLLADRARARGVKRFTASMLAENVAAHRLFAAVSDRLATEHHGMVDELVADLDPRPRTALAA